MARASAFDILYREYYARVFGLCRRLLNSSTLAEDAAQETFARAFRRFDSFKADQPFWQWVAAIASNHCIDLLRQKQRRDGVFAPDEADLEAVAGSDAPPEQRTIAAQEADAVNAAIDTLPDRYRVPLLLAGVQQASYDEIAAQLGVTRNHVGVLLLRARQRLRAALADGPGELQP